MSRCDLQFTKLGRDLKVPGGGKQRQSDADAEAGDGVAALADNVDDLDLR